jgi:hypothetical protein
MRRERGLAFQATVEVEPADKRLPLVINIDLLRGLSLMERFDSEEVSNLLVRKTHPLEPLDIRSRWGRLLEFHSYSPVSLNISLLPIGREAYQRLHVLVMRSSTTHCLNESSPSLWNSLKGSPGEVTLHQLASHFPSLSMALRLWVTQQEHDRRISG